MITEKNLITAPILKKTRTKTKISNVTLFDNYINAKATADNQKEIIKTRNILIMHNQQLITHVINKYFSKTMISKSSMQDLIQEGCFGLAEAIDRFKPEKGYKFSTYAAWWIRQAVGSAIKENETIIVIPPHIINLQNKYIAMAQKNGCTFEEALKSDYKNKLISEKMMKSAIAAINSGNINSLDIEFDKAGTNENKKTIVNKNLMTIVESEQGVDKTKIIFTMKEALKKLGPKKRNVLLLRFGIIEEPIVLSKEKSKNAK